MIPAARLLEPGTADILLQQDNFGRPTESQMIGGAETDDPAADDKNSGCAHSFAPDSIQLRVKLYGSTNQTNT